jgi:predicted glycosyltransferase
LPELDCGAARLFQLPPLRAADETFKTLIDEGGRTVDEPWKAARRDRLLQRFAETRPDVLITELFPFGRRMLEFELMPLLEAAQARRLRPLILCSLRDVLIPPRAAAKIARALERARAFYDHILVHGDPALIDLPASYPATRELCDRITYTGYVTAPRAPDAPAGEGEDEVIVSAGGGAVGGVLLETAAAAQAQSDDGRRWRLLIGSDVPAEIRRRLHAAKTARLIVEPARRDFPSLLRRCHVSISQAGYNTVMDILDARAPAVLVPFAVPGETEQTMRAAALAARGWAELLPEEALSPAALAGAISSAAARGRPDTTVLRHNGAGETVHLVRELLHGRGRA